MMPQYTGVGLEYNGGTPQRALICKNSCHLTHAFEDARLTTDLEITTTRMAMVFPATHGGDPVKGSQVRGFNVVCLIALDFLQLTLRYQLLGNSTAVGVVAFAHTIGHP